MIVLSNGETKTFHHPAVLQCPKQIYTHCNYACTKTTVGKESPLINVSLTLNHFYVVGYSKHIQMFKTCSCHLKV